jgi:hypothetical protein
VLEGFALEEENQRLNQEAALLKEKMEQLESN